jgi:hypothetical protein
MGNLLGIYFWNISVKEEQIVFKLNNEETLYKLGTNSWNSNKHGPQALVEIH